MPYFFVDTQVSHALLFTHRTKFEVCMAQRKLSGPNGESKTKHELFRTWSSMVQRCTNPNVRCFMSYGGKGVSVCERWMNFWLFVQDVKTRPSKKHTLDRIDTNGNYEPGNVRWATQKEQLRNQSRNVRIAFGGTEKCVSEWAEETGLSKEVIFSRLRKLGWSVEKTLTTPARKRSCTA